MSHVPHELTEVFAAEIEALHRLKSENAHIAKLCDEHHLLNREIHRGETNVEPMSDEHLEELKKRRLAILDEISAALHAGR